MLERALIFSRPGDDSLVAKVRAELLEIGIRHIDGPIDETKNVWDLAFKQPPDVIVCVTDTPDDILAIAPMNAKVIWHMGRLAQDPVDGWLAESESKNALARAIARADALAAASPGVRTSLEAGLQVGSSATTLGDAIRYLNHRVLIVLGSGLGNMLNATPMIRWVSESIGAKIDIVINSGLDVATELFAEARWVARAFPGFEFLIGKHYDVEIITTFADPIESTCSADVIIQQQKTFNYNRQGRFIRDADTSFLGLDRAFRDVPSPGGDIPMPFVRDAAYEFPDNGVIGIANGVKAGIWAKRQWPFIGQLAEALTAMGHEVRSFGLKDELVPGTVDRTGLSIRDTVREMRQCSYFIGHDGGMCHLADAIGVPSLWFFGPTANLKNGPMRDPSIVLTSDPECGPCNYRSDWIRCADPTCMSDITVEHALAAFKGLKSVEQEGCAPRHRMWDPAVVEREIAAASGPPRRELQARSNAERLTVLPADATQHLSIALALLRQGDLDGLLTFVPRACSRFPQNAALQAMSLLVNDFVGAQGAELALLPDLNQAWGAASSLRTPVDLRTFAEAWMCCLLRRNDFDGLANFAGFVMKHAISDGHMLRVAKWAEKLWAKVLANYKPAEFVKQRAALTMMSAGNEPILAMIKNSADPGFVLNALNGVIDELAGNSAETPYRLAPSLATLARTAPPSDVQLPGIQGRVPAWSAVVLLTRIGDITSLRPGSFTTSLVTLARAMASSSLRPFIVNLTVGAAKPIVTFADNVTYVNAAPAWDEPAWDALWRLIAPAVAYDFYGTSEAAVRPPNDLVSVAPRGFYRGETLNPNLFEEVNWDPLPQPTADGSLVFDDLLGEFIGTLEPASVLPLRDDRDGIGVLINDIADLSAFVDVCRQLPHIHFYVVADAFHRGIEPNITYMLRPSATPKSLYSDKRAVMQFATRETDLSADMLAPLSLGIPVYGTSAMASRTVHFVKVAAPFGVREWTTALRSTWRKPLSTPRRPRISEQGVRFRA